MYTYMYSFIHTVKQNISADMLFLRLGDFTVERIFIFADAGTEHSSFIVLLSYISIEIGSFIFADWMSTPKITCR